MSDLADMPPDEGPATTLPSPMRVPIIGMGMVYTASVFMAIFLTASCNDGAAARGRFPSRKHNPTFTQKKET